MIILLTGTVSPDGMFDTKLQNPDLRKKQYIEAIDFYLRETDLKIVFCENTCTNFFYEINSDHKYDRLEFITFNGNDYPKEFGKGYGEAKIIHYVIKHSRFLQNDNFFIKITGRVKILNIHDIISQFLELSHDINTIMIELCYNNHARSVCYITSKQWMYETLMLYSNKLNDSKAYYFERMMFQSILNSKKIRIKPCFAKIEGISGTFLTKYENYPLIQIKVNHYNTLCILYKSRNERLRYLIAKINWYYNLVLRKVFIWLKLI